MQSPLAAITPSAPAGPPSAGYFPSSMARMYGFLPIPQAVYLVAGDGKGKGKAVEDSTAGTKLFPSNIRFVAQDWMEAAPFLERFDVVVA